MLKPSFFIWHYKTRGFRKVDHVLKPGLAVVAVVVVVVVGIVVVPW